VINYYAEKLRLVLSDLNKNFHFYAQVCVVIFCNKLKGTTTEDTEALRYTEKRRVTTDISPRTQYNYSSPSIERDDEIRL